MAVVCAMSKHFLLYKGLDNLRSISHVFSRVLDKKPIIKSYYRDQAPKPLRSGFTTLAVLVIIKITQTSVIKVCNYRVD